MHRAAPRPTSPPNRAHHHRWYLANYPHRGEPAAIKSGGGSHANMRCGNARALVQQIVQPSCASARPLSSAHNTYILYMYTGRARGSRWLDCHPSRPARPTHSVSQNPHVLAKRSGSHQRRMIHSRSHHLPPVGGGTGEGGASGCVCEWQCAQKAYSEFSQKLAACGHVLSLRVIILYLCTRALEAQARPRKTRAPLRAQVGG